MRTIVSFNHEITVIEEFLSDESSVFDILWGPDIKIHAADLTTAMRVAKTLETIASDPRVSI